MMMMMSPYHFSHSPSQSSSLQWSQSQSGEFEHTSRIAMAQWLFKIKYYTTALAPKYLYTRWRHCRIHSFYESALWCYTSFLDTELIDLSTVVVGCFFQFPFFLCHCHSRFYSRLFSVLLSLSLLYPPLFCVFISTMRSGATTSMYIHFEAI